VIIYFRDKETIKNYNQTFSKKLPTEIQRVALRKKCMDRIETPKISEILLEEFMKPLHLSAYKLAHSIGVPVSRVQDILHDRRKITIDTSIRLGIFFGLTDMYFMNIQNDIDLRNAKIENEAEFEKIVPYMTRNISPF